MSVKVSKAIILAMFICILVMLASYGFRNERESVEVSLLGCVVSVCIESSTAGESCSVLTPTVSEIVVETDRHDRRFKNIRVIPSNDRCQ